MNARNRVVIVFIVSFLASIFIVGFAFVAVVQTQVNVSKLGVVSDLRANVFDRANFLDDYLLYRKESTARQWLSMSQKINGLLAQTGKIFKNNDESALLVLIEKNENIIDQIGAKLFANYSTQTDAAKSRAVEQQLIGQLLASRSEMASQASRLEDIVREEISFAQDILDLSIWLVTVLLFIIIAIDLTWIRMIVKRLETTAAKEAAMLESIGAGMIAVDEDARVIAMSRSAEKMLGWQFKEIKGKKLFDIVPMLGEEGTPIPEKKRPMYVALAAGKNTTTGSTATSNCYFYTRRDGSSFPVAIAVAPIMLQGKIIGAIDNFSDITDEKEVDRAKSEFVSLASHQLRTPPTSIKWFLEMLLAEDVGPLNEKQKEYFNEVYKSNERMIALVNSLLNTSRIELGVLAVEPAPTDIVALSKGVIDEMSQQIREKKLHVSEKYSDDLKKVSVDPKLLRIIMQNIVSNAVKYTPSRGGINLKISIEQKDARVGSRTIKKESLVMIVSDTGCGIPEGQQDKIFTKLFRADNAKEKEVSGSGLGLYLTKSIVRHIKGHIWFESAINKGTTFYLMIPLEGMKKREGTTTLVAGSVF